MRVLVLTAMYPTHDRPAAGTFVKQQVDSLIAAGVDVEVMHFEGNRSFKRYLSAGRDLRRRLRHDHFDLVHAHYGLTGLPAMMQRTCPVVITFHGSDLLGEVGPDGRYTFAGRFKVLLGQLMGQMAAERIVVARILQKRLWPRDSVVIPMGVDLDTFRPQPMQTARKTLGLDPDRPYVLFLANPANGVKRFDVAQAAVEVLKPKFPDLELLPIHQARHDEIPLYLNAADTLVMTSNHEASPCVIKEALACNLPIVSVDVGDVAERIHAVDGCYLCERTPEDVAAKLTAALSTGKRTNGRDKIADLSLDVTAQQTLSVFRRAIRTIGNA